MLIPLISYWNGMIAPHLFTPQIGIPLLKARKMALKCTKSTTFCSGDCYEFALQQLEGKGLLLKGAASDPSYAYSASLVIRGVSEGTESRKLWIPQSAYLSPSCSKYLKQPQLAKPAARQQLSHARMMPAFPKHSWQSRRTCQLQPKGSSRVLKGTKSPTLSHGGRR